MLKHIVSRRERWRSTYRAAAALMPPFPSIAIRVVLQRANKGIQGLNTCQDDSDQAYNRMRDGEMGVLIIIIIIKNQSETSQHGCDTQIL